MPAVDRPTGDSIRQRETLTRGTRLSFGAQGAFGAAMGLMLAVYLPKFYTDVVLLPAGILAIGIAVARAFDAITDPVMGYVSDHTKSRWGRRKPWIAVGVVGNAVAFTLLLSPPATLSTGASWWFGVCFITSFLFVTIVAIPRAALAVEQTLDGRQRQALYGTIAAFVALGLVVGAVMPNVLAQMGIGDPRRVMRTLAIVYVSGYLALNALFLWKIKERREYTGRGENPFVPGFRRALRSRPFRIMFVSHVVTAIPIAIPATLMPFYVTYVMKSANPTKWIGYLLLAYLGSGFLALPLWVALARRIGKLRVWLIVSFIGVSGGTLWFFMGPGDERMALLVQLYVGMQASVWFFLGGAMHADIVDYDELHTGKRREAQFSAFWAIIPKFALIPGASIPIAILAEAGYRANQPQTPEVVMTLRVLFALVPAAFNAIGLSIMWWYPLSEKAHAEIRAGIAEHEAGRAGDRSDHRPGAAAARGAPGGRAHQLAARLLLHRRAPSAPGARRAGRRHRGGRVDRGLGNRVCSVDHLRDRRRREPGARPGRRPGARHRRRGARPRRDGLPHAASAPRARPETRADPRSGHPSAPRWLGLTNNPPWGPCQIVGSGSVRDFVASPGRGRPPGRAA